ncbi:MAG: hypothetical protein WDN45_13180 [Caulobacteraceae bacterium]
MTEKRGLLLSAGDRDPELLLGIDAEGRPGKVREQSLDFLVADRRALDGL